ncbi:aldehyde dehydrogenase family protein [Vitreoscilla massiliensis]|uniref:Aldehyde dehydrogenase family protein n=1 Tax=Vitreoscilla massiliensis TaxID=1689272 RepID=A0ABY4E1P9_9NEIS|nr:aldehyde dehydrogenase family protein [Vitreoscilla massiliensis]UOO89707.1 aldehyde dehydrogenase family protein [Vitreoscilla massiliensis]
MSERFSVVTPIDGSELCSREYASSAEIATAVQAAQAAQAPWFELGLAARKAKIAAAIDWLVTHKDEVAAAITHSMGRPISQSPGEVKGLEERARYMLSIADAALADIVPEEKAGFKRFLRREPVGLVLVMAPWNYPFLTAVNAIVPALAAGNVVLLKHSSQTPQVAELFQAAFDAAGLPAGVFQSLHMNHADTDALLQSDAVDFVAFTGSVNGGHQVQAAISKRFIGAGLELGGKDPAYVRADADVASAAENLVDGSFFNSGQSCCGIERIYVHESVYEPFLQEFVRVTKQYRLGNPTDANTNLGPMVRSSAADFVRAQIAEAVAQGAKSLVDEAEFPASQAGTAYLAPHVLADVTHDMRVMREESFGPVVGIMAVKDDAEAIRLMNDSDYGLTASIWTQDAAAAEALAAKIATGTVFMNRCDYLDPALAWTGVKDTGHGISLSELGYAQLTRIKSYHLRVA